MPAIFPDGAIDRRATAFHEAAHGVVGLLIGAEPMFLALSGHKRGHARLMPPPGALDDASFKEALVTCALAGCAGWGFAGAERSARALCSLAIRRREEDVAIACGLLEDLGHDVAMHDGDPILLAAFERAIAVTAALEAPITAIAEALLRHGQLQGGEVTAIASEWPRAEAERLMALPLIRTPSGLC